MGKAKKTILLYKRKSTNYTEAYKWYAAQVIPQIDAEIAEKRNFCIETI